MFFFVKWGGLIASAEGTSIVGGGLGVSSPPENFQIWRLRNVIFYSRFYSLLD